MAVEQADDEVQVAGPAAPGADGDFTHKVCFAAGSEGSELFVVLVPDAGRRHPPGGGSGSWQMGEDVARDVGSRNIGGDPAQPSLHAINPIALLVASVPARSGRRIVRFCALLFFRAVIESCDEVCRVGSGRPANPNDARRTSFDFPPVDRDDAFTIVDALRPIASRHVVSVARVALAWLLHHESVMSVIIGAKTPEQLQDNLAASTVSLAPADLAALDEISALTPEYPGWMVDRQSTGRVPEAR
jgi:hypothetical protein